jgi:competence protein ComEC
VKKDEPARQPLLWAALALSVGLAGGARTWRPASWWIASLIVFSAAALWFTRGRSWAAKALSLSLWFVLGALMIQVRGGERVDPRIFELAEKREVVLTAHVIREGYVRESGLQAFRQMIDVETESVETEDGSFPIRGGVRLTIYRKSSQLSVLSSQKVPQKFAYGTRWRMRAKLHLPRNFRNPGAFDYEGYLHDNAIVVLGSAKAEEIAPLPGFAGNRIELWRTQAHASIVNKVHELWPQEQAALMDAMVLGEDSFLRNATRTEFQRSGTYHVLVVSGMNLSILAFVIFWTLRQFRLDPALAGIATVVASFAYAFLVGVGAPVWRAALMLALYLGARLLYRGRNMLNAIGAAAIGVLIADPKALFGPSFQLTFLAVFIIAAIGVPILERTTLPYQHGLRLLRATSYDLHVEPAVAQYRLDLRLIGDRLSRFLGERAGHFIPVAVSRMVMAVFDLVFISALMQAGLALLMAYHFHRATSMGMPANLAVVPLTQALMPAAAAAVGLGYISIALAKPAVWVSGVALDGIAGTVHWLGGARIADMRVATPTLIVIIVGLTALALAAIVARRHRLLAVPALLLLASVALWIALAPARPRMRDGRFEITSIDVGQGDALLLVTPEGRRLLLDAGGMPLWTHSEFDIGEQVVSPYLWQRGIDRLDAVIISHPHADHLGGMPAVIANFHPRELWLGDDTPAGELVPVLKAARDAGMQIIVHKEGDDFEYGGAHFHVYAPGRDSLAISKRVNDDCLVMTAGTGNTAALLEGDAERIAEERVVAEHPQASLLKVAHHGSASATSNELLRSVHPTFAVISVGARNGYGHPRQEVLQRLGNAGVKTYRTDVMGAVRFYLDGKSVTRNWNSATDLGGLIIERR